jgi:hypothetical protein
MDMNIPGIMRESAFISMRERVSPKRRRLFSQSSKVNVEKI